MDTRENGQLHRDAGGRPRRSAGWLARAAVSAAFLLGMAFLSIAFAQDQQPPVVTAAKPVVREIVEDDEFVGRFEAVDQVAIRSRVSGYLDKVSFQDGALVNKGDLLFTIDQRPYQAAYDAAKSQVDVAKSLLEFSKMQLDRADELAKTGNIST
ncbi:MAG: efflux RND transporter periplasmic adaptor subunit, partial [Mesorhizobium sp.]